MEMRRENFGDDVASEEFVFLSRDGASRRVKVRIGMPYEVSSDEWACPVEIVGFEPRHPDARGSTSLQALCLAVTLVRSRVEDFISKGGKVLDIDGRCEWDAKSLAAVFGAMGVNAA